MTHFGIICPPYPGHLNPHAALGRELRSRGHRVTVLQVADMAAKVRSEGLEFYPIGQASYQPGSFAATFVQLARLSGLRALQYSVASCREMAAIIGRDAPRAIDQTGIEVLLVDQLEPAGETVAAGLGLPFLCISCGQAIHRQPEIPPFFTPWLYQGTDWAMLRNQIAYALLDRHCQPIIEVLNQYRRQWRLSPYQQMYATHTQLAHLSQQAPLFDFPCFDLPDYFHYVGPLRNMSPRPGWFPFDRLTGQPLIYASLGSVQNTKYEIFQAIAAACAPLPVQLAIAHGGGMTQEQAAQLPGTPLVVEYAPQLEVLAQASLTITHGGMNTVLDSLSHGVPLIAIPITFEQPGTGARVRWTGVGEVVPLSRLTLPRLRAAIERVLTEPAYTKNAQRVQRSIALAGGVSRAADLVEAAIGVKRQAIEKIGQFVESV